MMSDDLRFAIRSGQRDRDLALEHDEHIDLPLTRSKERVICREGLLPTVRTKTIDHLLGELGKGEFRPKVRNVRCTGGAASLFGHGRWNSLLNSIIRHGKAAVYVSRQREVWPAARETSWTSTSVSRGKLTWWPRSM